MTLHDWTGLACYHAHHGLRARGNGPTPSNTSRRITSPSSPASRAVTFTSAMEIWETTGKDALEASLATGDTVDLGETGMEAIEEWWYPLYVKEDCPGLPNWEALNDCAELFATAQTSPKGRYHSVAR